MITIKTKQALEAYNILNGAKYSKLEDADKIKLWKIVRALKPIATKFQEDVKDASDKFKSEFEGFDENLKKAQDYEKCKAEGKEDLPMTEEEYKAFIEVFKKYNKLVSDAVNEFAEAEVNLNVETLSEDAFGKLLSSNDWSIDKTTSIDFMIG
jgi:ClpP class serine protease